MNANDPNMSDSSLSEYGQSEPQPAALPLGVGGMDGDGADMLTGGIDAEGKSRAGQLLLALVVVVAVGGLFFMRTLAKVTLASTNVENESMVEDFLSGRDGEITSSVADMRIATIGVLTESYQKRQVPTDDLSKDPFVLAGEEGGPEVEFDEIDPGTAAERMYNQQVAAAEQRFEQAVSKLRLQSVLMGSNPVANISGNVIRTGDTVRQADTSFTVLEITADQVELEVREEALHLVRTYTIRIDRP